MSSHRVRFSITAVSQVLTARCTWHVCRHTCVYCSTAKCRSLVAVMTDRWKCTIRHLQRSVPTRTSHLRVTPALVYLVRFKAHKHAQLYFTTDNQILRTTVRDTR